MPKVIKNVHDRVGAQPYSCPCRSGGVKGRGSDGNTQLLKRGRDCKTCLITSKGSSTSGFPLQPFCPAGLPPSCPSKKGCSSTTRLVFSVPILLPHSQLTIQGQREQGKAGMFAKELPAQASALHLQDLLFSSVRLGEDAGTKASEKSRTGQC